MTLTGFTVSEFESLLPVFRILVEHAIGGVKRCRIVKERLRCTKLGFEDKVMIIACGLHNFRIALKNNAVFT